MDYDATNDVPGLSWSGDAYLDSAANHVTTYWPLSADSWSWLSGW